MSKIEWTGETWNPIVGCSKISPGCENCYAETMAVRMTHLLGQNITDSWAAYSTAVNGKVWSGKTDIVNSALNKPIKRKKPQTYFVCSMGDLFHESVAFDWIFQVMQVIKDCPQHTFQILTKRAEKMKVFFDTYQRLGTIPSNLWLGVTAENQEQAEKRIPILLDTQAKVMFLSIEPMLGGVDLTKIHGAANYYLNALNGEAYSMGETYIPLEKHQLDWVICGGESGHKARPMHPDWVRSLKDQCDEADVPFFFKQWGEWMPWEYDAQLPFMKSQNGQLVDSHTMNIIDPETSEESTGWSVDFENGVQWQKVGKKKAGSLLDGKEHKEFPRLK